MGVDAVIFDCFGVLYSDGVGRFYDRHPEIDAGLCEQLDAQVDLGRIDNHEYCERLSTLTGEPAERVRAEISSGWAADRALLDLIGDLRREYRTALLSNAGESEIELIYRDGVYGLFDVITVSYKVGVMKPDPAIYHCCLDQLGVMAERAVFVDDSPVNLEAAKRLGLRTIAYPTFGTVPTELRAMIGAEK